MQTDSAITIHRSDYRPYPFRIETVQLAFDLDPAGTRVRNTLRLQRVPGTPANTLLVLDGEDIELLGLSLDGQPVEAARYRLDARTLSVAGLPESCTLTIDSLCRPDANTKLMGLYVSGESLFTQCEAEGFRRITWFPDRPDVMSRYQVTLRADKNAYPVMLSNGNLISSTELPDSRHETVWEDPFPKPSYLFALVAGRFACRQKTTHTASGREVLLQVYSDPGSEAQTEWALDSLERALRWDEQRFGLELDLDRFMVVATRDFNMGAMENKGLNIFNAAYVLAHPDSATDANYEAIESVIGHEYFHNWTGNRVTCRDWFQLSLKEGLTVFRDQEFTADMMAEALQRREEDAAAGSSAALAQLRAAQASARAVKRIDDVIALRAAQFPEDAGPMAHPIRPESYQEIGNFYTATVYEKGAEVIRMQHRLLGEAGFRQGMDDYFARFDGQAVTCDDFVDTMEAVYTRQHPGQDFSIFRRWYAQAGTPRVKVTLAHDSATQRCTITLQQRCDKVGVETQRGADYVKHPFHIPFALGLLAPDGTPLPLSLNGEQSDTVLLELREEQAQWHFDSIAQRPVPSLLRDFSAPVIVEYDWTDEELALLSEHDPDAFARWEAGQELAAREILRHARDMDLDEPVTLSASLVRAWATLLHTPALDPAYRARALALPLEKTLLERMRPMHPGRLAAARLAVRAELGRQLGSLWLQTYHENMTPGAYSPDPLSTGRRSLKNLALSYLCAPRKQDGLSLAQQQFQKAGNMTDSLAALACLVNDADTIVAQNALGDFYTRWHHDPLVVDKWFAVQAASCNSTVALVRKLTQHPAFTLLTPNRVRALVFQFCMNNALNFHTEEGAGYAFWAEQMLLLDPVNPEIAARLARVFDRWSLHAPELREKMLAALELIAAEPSLSRNTSEIIQKSLNLGALEAK
ncbi:aminopeptidase N [Corticimicrobacter populi]|uniref:Aminopeptidase N n=1 Tax=Corticimicrobacter populi TaxID=2175229 RepID=A0A2V1K164_9BURK|nr:aminopeptidase N [Corticimicrobacter populi]PWF24946.1 aminopeptidase N [Corticimicrobacter populi]